MPRKLRVHYPGAVYHIMNRGDRREAIFSAEADRQRLLDTFGRNLRKLAAFPCPAMLTDDLGSIYTLATSLSASGQRSRTRTGRLTFWSKPLSLIWLVSTDDASERSFYLTLSSNSSSSPELRTFRFATLSGRLQTPGRCASRRLLP